MIPRAYLNNQYTSWTRATQPDGFGGDTETWSVRLASKPCRLTIKEGQVMVSNGLFQARYDAVMLHDDPLTAGELVEVDGQLFKVVSCRPVESLGLSHHETKLSISVGFDHEALEEA